MTNEVEKSKREADVKITKLLEEAQNLIYQAEELANEHGIGFSFEIAYGMGGYFHPGSEVAEDSWLRDEFNLDENGGWVASSQTC